MNWLALLLARLETWLSCKALGHDILVWQEFGRTSRHIYCERCQNDWGMNDTVPAIIPWSGELEELYATMGHRVIRRRKWTPYSAGTD